MLYLALRKVKVSRYRAAHQLLKFAELRLGGHGEAEYPPGEFGKCQKAAWIRTGDRVSTGNVSSGRISEPPPGTDPVRLAGSAAHPERGTVQTLHQQHHNGP
ncbi:hypothetical protein [Deinococcus sp.]|uniref:hypothetical protein n=1 Tax=Deinococcus sp. TaxID=47478 RepID=UPI00286DB0AB|nr:hypothetical protein [Deinococcus sp.]